jgi:hypothetical protein
MFNVFSDDTKIKKVSRFLRYFEKILLIIIGLFVVIKIFMFL